MSKRAVAYFSTGGVTAGVAKTLSRLSGADLYEIKPAVPYTEADLNWRDKHSRSSIETNDAFCRPALADTGADFSGYEVIFLGFPVWWYSIPAIIRSFVEAYDFSGKVIVPFATSGGSGMGRTNQELQGSCRGADLREGRCFRAGVSATELQAWVDGLGL